MLIVYFLAPQCVHGGLIYALNQDPYINWFSYALLEHFDKASQKLALH